MNWFTALQENALSLLIFANKNVIEISWTTITSGNPTFNSVFTLRSITNCYDIITIYHLPILSTAARDFSRISPFSGTNPSEDALP